jgi:regulatory protein
MRYVGRYATSRAKLHTYLRRKVQERGWDSDRTPDLTGLVEEFATLGYVDDGAFASARSASLVRRGYGERRVSQVLTQAGIQEADAGPAREHARLSALEAALRLARKRRIGPYAVEPATCEEQQRAIAALVRAGHDFALARRIASAQPGDDIETMDIF